MMEMIIDAHTHIDRANNVDWTPQQLIAGMDEAGIQHSIVISNHLTEAPLDKILNTVKGYDRFHVIGNIEFSHLNNAQIDKLVGHLERKEIVGVKLFPGYENYFPYDNKLDKLFDYMQRNDHPLLVHTGVLMVGHTGYLDQAHPLHINRIGAKFPKLKIVIAHMGNPWLVDTVAVMWQNPLVYTDLSGFFVEFRSLHPREVKNFLHRMKEIRDLLGNFKRCIFGTDWPLYSQKEYLDAVKQIELSDEERDLVFWKNANNVYNLRLAEK